MAVNNFGVVKIDNLKTLIREIKRMLKHSSITITGPSGTGKTTIVEALREEKDLGIDKIVVFRLQGLSSEDFRLPIVEIEKNGEKEEKYVKFTDIGVFKEIKENPDKTFLLFLDEYIRASRDVAPLLFSILEGKLPDGTRCENMKVMAAINYGDEYSSNIDFTDDALRRRQIFIDYVPSKKDFINFIKKNEYHPVIQEIADRLNITSIINHTTTSELEQPTTFGSWHLFNERLKEIEKELGRKLSYSEISEDLFSFGNFFFNKQSLADINELLAIIIQLESIDIQKQIIDKNGLKPGNKIFDKQGNEFIIENEGQRKELLVRTLHFAKKSALENKSYLKENGFKLLEIFEEERTLIMSLIKQIQAELLNIYKDDTATYAKVSKEIFYDFSKIILESAKSGKVKDKALAESFVKIYNLMES